MPAVMTASRLRAALRRAPWAFAMVLVVAAAWRATGLYFGLPRDLHPDEFRIRDGGLRSG